MVAFREILSAQDISDLLSWLGGLEQYPQLLIPNAVALYVIWVVTMVGICMSQFLDATTSLFGCLLSTGHDANERIDDLNDNIDKRQKLQDAPFDFQITKDQRILIYWQGKPVKILAGKAAQKLIAILDELDDNAIQLALAKATGNFKHGNERESKSRE